MKQFEDMTIADLRKLYEQTKRLHPEIKTAEELLEEERWLIIMDSVFLYSGILLFGVIFLLVEILMFYFLDLLLL